MIKMSSHLDQYYRKKVNNASDPLVHLYTPSLARACFLRGDRFPLEGSLPVQLKFHAAVALGSVEPAPT
jgi:hypothetical protein